MLEHIERNRRRADHGLYRYRQFDGLPEFTDHATLARQVATAAEFFRDRGVRPGSQVLLPFESSAPVVRAFLALMEVGAVPLSIKTPAAAPSAEAYLGFVERITRTFRPDWILGVATASGIGESLPVLPLPPDEVSARDVPLRVPDDRELAFVQFSSGSTSFPKGIPVRQDKLRANLRMIIRTGGHRPGERISSWLPLYHDMGLVGGMLATFATGGDLLLATPEMFLVDPIGWWAHLARERIAATVIPNFAIDYSLRFWKYAETAELSQLDLSRLQTIYLGSEPINIANLEAFLDVMSSAGLRREAILPCYGMAEAVLMVSSRPRGSGPRITSSPSGTPAISVGPPMPEFTVRLRNEEGRLCGDREIGEIELAGGSLADRYVGGTVPLREDDGFYRTGDLGFADSGELFITGRISDRIKVNGQSLFAADFEQAAEQLPFVRNGRTAVIQSGGRIVILVAIEKPARADPDVSRARIVEHLAQRVGVAVHPGDVHFVRSGQLLRTSSGKLQRRAIARAYEEGRLGTSHGSNGVPR